MAYVEAGADMIFPEAMTSLDDYRKFQGGGAGADPGQPHRSLAARRSTPPMNYAMLVSTLPCTAVALTVR